MIKRTLPIVASFLLAQQAHAFEPFTVSDIRIEGLQRISLGTVFNYLPVKVGSTFSEQDSPGVIKKLYKTRFFKDIRLEREGDVLVIFVSERPSIDEIKFEGNSEIDTEMLTKALSDQGLKVGGAYDESILDSMTQELQRQYYSLGKYGVKIETIAKPLERNRVAIQVKIAEGEEAEVYAINIIGNTVFDDDRLKAYLQLAGRGFFGGRENYSQQVLAGDLEALRSYYMDRGYLNFQIDSTQVSLTPNKEDVYVTVNIHEGKQFTVSDVKLTGDLILSEEVLKDSVVVQKGDTFSRRDVTKTRENISERLADLGYPFANVNVTHQEDKENQLVELTVVVDPGRRVYVRRINITGNRKTDDEVVRREMRQFENDWLSTSNVARSKTRLDRTGFFNSVAVNTPPVPGTTDQVDLNVKVDERSTGNLSLGVGYSETQGGLINFAITQDNFMGGGKKVGIKIDNSESTQQYSFSLSDPYFTDNGVSQNISLLSRELDAEEADIANYIVNTDLASLGYGFPLSEHTYTSHSLAVEDTELVPGANTSDQVNEFITNNNDGDSKYLLYKLSGNWSYDTRNKAIFADEGFRTRLSYEATTPGSELEFYKARFDYTHYFNLAENYTFRYSLDIDYGKAYGDTTELPPFERFFAGGSRTVRGFDGNSLGLLDSNGDPLGGDRRLVTNLEFFLPNPFSERSQEMRMSAFIDGGWVWAPGSKLDLGEMRYSAGVGLIWITPVGVMRFSLAEALNDKPDDDTTAFQFTLGTDF
jgi:outer membrane protein insertion porin family